MQLILGKKETIYLFLAEYKLAVQLYIDYIWSNTFVDQYNNICWDICNDKLYLPKYLNYKLIINEKLSARAMSAALEQAIGIVKGCVKIKSKLLYTIKKHKEEGRDTNYWERKLEKIKLSKPILKDNFKASLSQKQIRFKTGKYFDLFVKIYSTGFDIVKIPIKYNKSDKKWLKTGKILAGILLSHNCIELRYEIPDIPKKMSGSTVGGDTGLKTVLTLSNEQSTKTTDIHNHSLESICEKIARKKKGSKAFKKVVEHRLNFINWSINQLNFNGIKQINLEHISNFKKGKRTSKVLCAWSNRLIYNKIVRKLEEVGVQLNLQSSPYRSQRCSGCGIVRKTNRKGKEYKCKDCGLNLDSDLNAALNHEIDLPEIRYVDSQYLSKLKCFYWKLEGLFDDIGQELKVPDTNKV